MAIKPSHDKSLIEAACKNIKLFDYNNLLGKVLSLTNSDEKWRNDCINLVAAESLMSKTAQSILSNGLCMRTSGGYIGVENRYFVGTDNIDIIEANLFALLTDLFNCDQADWRLLGGTHACQTVYTSLCKSGDTIITICEDMGGDSSNTLSSMPGHLSLNIINMPFKEDGYTIDLERLEYLVKKYSPKLVNIGFSISLFFPPIKKIKEICSITDTILYYDAAHELGLIAGKCFDPFAEGIDVMTGSTGKSFSGPQGGVILWNNNSKTSLLESNIFPGSVGTYQLGRVMSLFITTIELKEFGIKFMLSVVNNAKSLANALSHKGLDIFAKANSYTETNQVVILLPDNIDPYVIAKKLEKVNIICNPVCYPGKKDRHALRLGTVEVTRLGMGSTEMHKIAELIYTRIYDKISEENCIKEVLSLKNKFKEIKYC